MKRMSEVVKTRPTAYIMCGIPGSGKSTYIENNLKVDEVVSRDIIRVMLNYSKSVDQKMVGTREQEEHVTRTENELIEKLCKANKTFVIDDINTGKYRKNLIELLRKHNAYIIGVNINTPLDVCIKRREGQISPEILTKIHKEKRLITNEEVDEVINVN